MGSLCQNPSRVGGGKYISIQDVNSSLLRVEEFFSLAFSMDMFISICYVIPPSDIKENWARLPTSPSTNIYFSTSPRTLP
jgi:hypothetical protein